MHFVYLLAVTVSTLQGGFQSKQIDLGAMVPLLSIGIYAPAEHGRFCKPSHYDTSL